VSLLAFVWVFFATGRKWLALLGIGVLSGSMILNLSPAPKLTFLSVKGLRTIQTFGGASYSMAEGPRNPWVGVFSLGVLLIAVFVADASVTVWRRGGRRRAIMVGGTITTFVVIAGLQRALVDAGVVTVPYLVSFSCLLILVALGTEPSGEVLQASQLAHDLHESEKRMNLAAEVAHLGPWVWDVAREEFKTTPHGRALLGFSTTEGLDRESGPHVCVGDLGLHLPPFRYSKAGRVSAPPTSHVALADHLLRRGRFDDALPLVERLISDFPDQRAGPEMKAFIERAQATIVVDVDSPRISRRSAEGEHPDPVLSDSADHDTTAASHHGSQSSSPLSLPPRRLSWHAEHTRDRHRAVRAGVRGTSPLPSRATGAPRPRHPGAVGCQQEEP